MTTAEVVNITGLVVYMRQGARHQHHKYQIIREREREENKGLLVKWEKRQKGRKCIN